MSVFISKELIPKIERYYNIKMTDLTEEVGYGEQAMAFEDVTDSCSDLEDWLENGDVLTCYEDADGQIHYKVSVENGVFDFVLDKENVEYESYLEDIKSDLNNLFSNASVEDFRTLCQNLQDYDEYKKSHEDVIDFDLIDKEDYESIVKEAITEYIEKNDIKAEIKGLSADDVVMDGDNSFTYKGEEYQGFDSSDGGDFDCTSCENFDLIYEAVLEANCEDKEELTMYLCGMNFVYKNLVDDVMYKFYFK